MRRKRMGNRVVIKRGRIRFDVGLVVMTYSFENTLSANRLSFVGGKTNSKKKKLKSLRLFKRILKYPPNPGFSCKLLTHYSGTISGSTYDKDKNEDRKIGANITDSPLSPFSPLTPG